MLMLCRINGHVPLLAQQEPAEMNNLLPHNKILTSISTFVPQRKKPKNERRRTKAK